MARCIQGDLQLKNGNIMHFNAGGMRHKKEDTLKEERRETLFPSVKLHISHFTANNDKVALWCRQGGFHFPLTSNSRYLILTGNAELWGCYPDCVFGVGAPRESRANMKKQSGGNYLLLVVSGSSLVFSKVLQPALDSSARAWLKPQLSAWGECLMRSHRCD